MEGAANPRSAKPNLARCRPHQPTQGRKSVGIKDPTPLPVNPKFKKSESDSVAAAEKDLRRAQESLKAANDLTLEDYISIYLPTLRENPEALQALAQKMSKEELSEVFKLMLRKDSPSDTKRNGLASGFSAAR